MVKRRGSANLVMWPLILGALGALAWMLVSGHRERSALAATSEELERVKSLHAQWIDAKKLLERTPRIALAAQIESSQRLPRELEDMELSTCAQRIAELRAREVRTSLDAFMAFLGQDDDRAKALQMQSDIEGLVAMHAQSHCDPSAEPMDQAELDELIEMRRAF